MGLIKLVKNRISAEWKKAFNDNVDYLNSAQEKTDEQINVTNKRIDNLVLHASGDNVAEVVDARVNAEGDTFDTLENRLNNSEEAIANELAYLNEVAYNNGESINDLIADVSALYNANHGTLEVYVSAYGSNTTGDGTEENPFLTIQAAVDSIALLNTEIVVIYVADGVYLEDVEVRGVRSDNITIRTIQNIDLLDVEANDLPVKVRSIRFIYCNGYFQIAGIQAVDQANAPVDSEFTYSFCCTNGGYLSLNKVRCAENTKSIEGHVASLASGGSLMHIYSSYFANQNTVNYTRYLSETRAASYNSGGQNNIGFVADGGTVRYGITTPNFEATTLYKAAAQGLIIVDGTILEDGILKVGVLNG